MAMCTGIDSARQTRSSARSRSAKRRPIRFGADPLLGPDGEERHQQHESDHEVAGDAGNNNDGLLPEGLEPIGAVFLFGGYLFEWVHPDDPHIPAERYGLHAVFGFTALGRPDTGSKPKEGLGGLHAEGFGRDEVSCLAVESVRLISQFQHIPDDGDSLAITLYF